MKIVIDLVYTEFKSHTAYLRFKGHIVGSGYINSLNVNSNSIQYFDMNITEFCRLLNEFNNEYYWSTSKVDGSNILFTYVLSIQPRVISLSSIYASNPENGCFLNSNNTQIARVFKGNKFMGVLK